MTENPIRMKHNDVKGVCVSDPNPSSGRDCCEQQAAPGRQQASVCRINTKKKPLKIATWNVRALNQDGKLENVIQEMDRMNLNVLGLAEVRWKGAGSVIVDNKTMIYSGGKKHEKGVGIIFDKETTKSLKGFCPISERIVVAKLEAKPLDLGIIQVYAPTAESEDEEIKQFYEELERAKKCLKSQDITIIMGDFNAKVGDERVDDVVGPYGLGTQNERGSKLIEWCQMNEFIITNTWFENHPRRQWTWKSPGDRTRNKIDYILIQKRFRNAVKISKSLPGADCDSDHIPVMCNFKIKLRKLKRAKNQPKFLIELLKADEQLKDQINVTIRNRYDALSNITEVEELWSKMKESIHEAMEDIIPKKNKNKDKSWMTKEILDLMEVRRKTKHDKVEYKKLNKEIKKKCNEEKEKWINAQCKEIEQNQNKDSKFMHSKINEVTGRKRYCSSPGLHTSSRRYNAHGKRRGTS